MADTKITALAAIATVDPAADVLPIVDISDTSMAASGTTKKVTSNQILGSGGTATLASATITGNLTVDTSTFFVDSSADKVGVGTTSLSGEKLTVAGNISANAWIGRSNIAAPTGDCSIFRSADNTLAFGITSSTAMTLNSTGLGIGTTILGGQKLAIGSSSDTSATTNGFNIVTSRATFATTCNGAVDAAGTTINYSWANGGQGPLIFRNAAIANVMTLDASGNLLVGTTNTDPTLNRVDGVVVRGNAGILMRTPSGYSEFGLSVTSGIHVYFASDNGTARVYGGNISTNGSTTAYNTTSDYRLKESVQPLVGGLARVNALKPSIYKWKTDGSNGEGFLAHELAEIVPIAVTGEKDAVKKDGSIDAQGVDMSKVIPILVAAIQELTARVQTLEAR